jgi:Flp pilus assembly protein TadD
MILAIAAGIAAAAPASAAAPSPASAGACPDVVTPDALVCRALEQQKNGNAAGAAQAFEEAARTSPEKDPKTARMFAAAGNLWIAAGQAGKAALALDKALSLPGLEAEQRGEALLDRARAAESQGDLTSARACLNDAAATISGDPFYWYFSAALAIREADTAKAKAAIAKALSLAPSEPTILFEAGHVAHFADDDARARYYWERAAAKDPNGAVGKSAREALAMLPAPTTIVTQPQPAKPKAHQPKS